MNIFNNLCFVKNGRKWHIIDAKGKILGRLASKIVTILCGKHKPLYIPHIDTGDYVIVLNANKVLVSGNKWNNKIYYHHTGYIGGIKKIAFKDMIVKSPEKVIKIAVKGMLPKGALGSVIYRKLKVYVGDQHKHSAQMPKFLDI